MNISGKFQVKGFSLVEMLVAVLILGGALIALAKFQGGLLQSGGEAKARAVAMDLAQKKLDDLRSFRWLDSDDANIDDCGGAPCTCANGFCFNEIVADGGGLEEAGVVVLPANDASVTPAGSTVSYTLTWNVTEWVFPQNGGTAVDVTGTDWTLRPDAGWNTAALGSKPLQPHYKEATVTVNWQDHQGNAQSVTLPGTISGTSLRSGARVATASIDRESPVVTHNPGAAPDVVGVPVEVSGGKKKETSKPEPEVMQSGPNDTTIVSFDVVTYDSANSNQAEQREEFITVSCECELEAPAVRRMVSRTLWDGAQLVDVVGQEVSKPTASSTITGGGVDQELCDLCCGDHHDYAGADPQLQCDPNGSWSAGSSRFNCYDAQRTTGYDANNAHLHYTKADIAAGNYGNPVTAVGDTYFEVCRLKRVEGTLRVFADWNLVDMAAFPYDYLTTAANLTGYQIWVQQVAQSEVDATVPAALANTEIDVLPGASMQGISRGVYVDEMTTEHIAALNTKIGNGEDWLEYVPFYEVNTTLLNTWYSANPAIATVTNEDIDTVVDVVNNYYGTYTRGLVVGVAAGGPINVFAASRKSNSGLTGSPQANPFLGATDQHDRNTIEATSFPVTVTGAASVHAISGIIDNQTIHPNDYKNASITITLASNPAGGAGTGCGPDQAHLGDPLNYNNGGKYFSYTCVVKKNADITITPVAAGYTFNPASRSWVGIAADYTSQNFTIAPIP